MAVFPSLIVLLVINFNGPGVPAGSQTGCMAGMIVPVKSHKQAEQCGG